VVKARNLQAKIRTEAEILVCFESDGNEGTEGKLLLKKKKKNNNNNNNNNNYNVISTIII